MKKAPDQRLTSGPHYGRRASRGHARPGLSWPRPLLQAFPGAVPTHHQDIGLTCLPAQPLDACGGAFAWTVNGMLNITANYPISESPNHDIVESWYNITQLLGNGLLYQNTTRISIRGVETIRIVGTLFQSLSIFSNWLKTERSQNWPDLSVTYKVTDIKIPR